jgi:hypothetical protein
MHFVFVKKKKNIVAKYVVLFFLLINVIASRIVNFAKEKKKLIVNYVFIRSFHFSRVGMFAH